MKQNGINKMNQAEEKPELSELREKYSIFQNSTRKLQRRMQTHNRVLRLKCLMAGSALVLYYPALVTGLSSLSAAIGSELLKLKYNSYDTKAVCADAAAGGLVILVPSIVVLGIVSYCLKKDKLISAFIMAAFISVFAGASGARLDVYPSETMTDAQALAASALGTLITTFGYYGLCYIYNECCKKPSSEQAASVGDVEEASTVENRL